MYKKKKKIKKKKKKKKKNLVTNLVRKLYYLSSLYSLVTSFLVVTRSNN